MSWFEIIFMCQWLLNLYFQLSATMQIGMSNYLLSMSAWMCKQQCLLCSPLSLSSSQVHPLGCSGQNSESCSWLFSHSIFVISGNPIGSTLKIYPASVISHHLYSIFLIQVTVTVTLCLNLCSSFLTEFPASTNAWDSLGKTKRSF